MPIQARLDLTTCLFSCLTVALLGGCADDGSPGDDEVAATETDSETTTETDSETSADEVGSEGETTSTDTAESTDTTETESGTETETDTETDTGEALSCRDILACAFDCLEDLGLECLQACGENSDPAELQAAGDLVFCLAQQCNEEGLCSLDDLTAPECVACLGVGYFLPQPPGCEEEAQACE
ncbi:hypothetical protein G6O69_24270 [Pseudenhygromyxa sp. WMMC2535]|uniref:hypothetical protein n=1 Tax=Pseudenhygromyxa sp. WMMC2535 TaxID=2712867 RepID=UPI001553C5BD|nr:hypothetical protein [Pseudenhygromyxa sp. WMMC2535]NVB40978.1 hypothetical protein [Pseudenhygromyxa sp. WMMC2535]